MDYIERYRASRGTLEAKQRFEELAKQSTVLFAKAQASGLIKNNKDKKDSTVLRSEIEKLKTEINQSMGWDAFTKTEQFKTFNALRNQITRQRRS